MDTHTLTFYAAYIERTYFMWNIWRNFQIPSVICIFSELVKKNALYIKKSKLKIQNLLSKSELLRNSQI